MADGIWSRSSGEQARWPEDDSTASSLRAAWTRAAWLSAGGLIVLRLIIIAVMPLVTDEAYYWSWAQWPDWGYFDHPPMVSWLASLGRGHTEPILARCGALLLTLAAWPLASKTLREFGVSAATGRVQGLVLMFGSLYAFGAGALLTPDVALQFFWLLVLHEAAIALTRDERRWLSAGVATGLGILGKYIMVLIGPALLVGLMAKKGSLRRPWPYAGALACLLTITPHLAWNHKNDWVTWRFQLGHGLHGSHEGAGGSGPPVPVVGAPKPESREWQLAQYFLAAESPAKPRPVKSEVAKLGQRLGDFGGAVFGLWGLMMVPLLIAIKRWRVPISQRWVAPELGALAVAATLVPLFVFGGISFFQAIEANWPAVYLIGASLCIARVAARIPGLSVAAFGNGLLVVTLALYAKNPFPLKLPGQDRALAETHGYQALGAVLKGIGAGLYAETYQLTAMAHLYGVTAVTQFPGLTRPSEFTRRQALAKDFKLSSGFWLVKNGMVPPTIHGYTAVSLTELRDCLSGFYKTRSGATPFYSPPCKDVIHRWFLVEYIEAAG